MKFHVTFKTTFSRPQPLLHTFTFFFKHQNIRREKIFYQSLMLAYLNRVICGKTAQTNLSKRLQYIVGVDRIGLC